MTKGQVELQKLLWGAAYQDLCRVKIALGRVNRYERTTKDQRARLTQARCLVRGVLEEWEDDSARRKRVQEVG